ncbi:MAG: dienelactone hydrolase family protein [Chloroflexota bacterium]
MNKIQDLQVDDWVLRYRTPKGDGPHPILLLLHGWTGDENTMWVFESHLPEDALLIAPRALHPASQGGYSWRIFEPGQPPPTIENYRPAADSLLALITSLPSTLNGNVEHLRLVGFSQGAALAYTLSILYPQRIQACASVAGFVPRGAGEIMTPNHLEGIPIYISHGVNDEIVPIERARQAVQLLGDAGAEITYCEADVGHKLSLDCTRGLDIFFRSQTLK